LGGGVDVLVELFCIKAKPSVQLEQFDKYHLLLKLFHCKLRVCVI
jgi:hypothetical protein